jgi:ubiquitin carboxyl-terminal hydrolase 7
MAQDHDHSFTPPSGELAALTIRDTQDVFNPDAPSPNAMILDQPEEHVVDPNGVENDELAIINPDSENEAPLATDCAFTGRPCPYSSAIAPTN